MERVITVRRESEGYVVTVCTYAGTYPNLGQVSEEVFGPYLAVGAEAMQYGNQCPMGQERESQVGWESRNIGEVMRIFRAEHPGMEPTLPRIQRSTLG